jgi:hypothetical protein
LVSTAILGGGLELCASNSIGNYASDAGPLDAVVRNSGINGNLRFLVGAGTSAITITAENDTKIPSLFSNKFNATTANLRSLSVVGTAGTGALSVSGAITVTDLTLQPGFHLINTTAGYGAVCALAQNGGDYIANVHKNDLVVLNGNTYGSIWMQAGLSNPSVFIGSNGNIGLCGVTQPSVALHGTNALFDSVSVRKLGNPTSMTVISNTSGALEFGVGAAGGQYASDAGEGDAVIRNTYPGKSLRMLCGGGTSAITIFDTGVVSIPGLQLNVVNSTISNILGSSASIGSILSTNNKTTNVSCSSISFPNGSSIYDDSNLHLSTDDVFSTVINGSERFILRSTAANIVTDLYVGASTQSNYIAFNGLAGDAQGSTYIGERIYESGTEKSELILMKLNDFKGTAGPDRIRSVAYEHHWSVPYTVNIGPSGLEDCCAAITHSNLILQSQGCLVIAPHNSIWNPSSDFSMCPLYVLGYSDMNLGVGSYLSAWFQANIACSGTIYTSDKRCKREIRDADLTESYNVISKSKVKKYKKDRDEFELGFIAQDIETVLPTAVHPCNITVDDKVSEGLGLDYNQLHMHAFKVIQDLVSRIEKLEKRKDV